MSKIKSKLLDKLFFYLLKRYLVEEMDQWERWKIKADNQDFFVEMYRGQGDGHDYVSIDKL